MTSKFISLILCTSSLLLCDVRIGDFDGDFLEDTIFVDSSSGRTNWEVHYKFVLSSNPKIHKTWTLGCFWNFFSVTPLPPMGSEETLCQQVLFKQISSGIPINEAPTNDLIWLLSKYSHGIEDSSLSFVWQESLPRFENYVVRIHIDSFPGLRHNLPGQLTRTPFQSAESDSISKHASKLYLTYYAHNHGSMRFISIDSSQISKIVYTNHGIGITRNGRFAWMFITDNIGKLRFPSIHHLNYSNKILTFQQVSVNDKAFWRIEIGNDTYRIVLLKKESQ